MCYIQHDLYNNFNKDEVISHNVIFPYVTYNNIIHLFKMMG